MRHASGPLISIDVGTGESETFDISDALESYIGGRGVGVKLAHDRIPFDADPFGERNRLFVTTGPMQASNMSFTGRLNATAVSPLTDGLASSNAGGYVSRNFIATGYAGMELTGSSDELVALIVTDEEVRREPVPELADATVFETSEYMAEEFGFDSEHLLTIGPAGENAVRFASIMTSDHRAFGRGGLGAVLGSKNVKTIAFDGDAAPIVELPDVADTVTREAATSDHIMKTQGTAFETEWLNDEISLPTGYYESMSFDEGVDGISGDEVEKRKYRKGTCSQCTFACKLPTRDDETGFETEGPELETVFAFGSNAKVDDIVDVMKSNDACDELGLDTISAGNTIAAYLKAEDEFGNADLIHDLIEDIAYRDGVGDLLAEGIDRIHDELGVDNWTVKGLDFPAHDGRVNHGLALSYATANRGADHMYSGMNIYDYFVADEPESLDGKTDVLVEVENQKAINDSGIFCRFSRNHVLETWEGEDYRDRYEALLGASYEKLMAIGHRIITLERHFNNERGFDRSDDDALPYDIDGLADSLDDYYALRGWDQKGIVPPTAIPAQ
ncbi:MAG: aldehyde ferredoxin oxidoreductase C-terminal domain-containing protein [archaeon]